MLQPVKSHFQVVGGQVQWIFSEIDNLRSWAVDNG